jgi:DNA-binding beta-propeller fold protein YncE
VTNDGTLLVADSGNSRIQVFDASGKFKFTFGGFGAGPGQFSRPRAIAADSDGNIYVADANFNNVQIFTPNGDLLMPLGRLSQTPGPGNFALIGAIAVDEGNRLYVTDNLFRKIEVFRRITDQPAGRSVVPGSPPAGGRHAPRS